MALNDLHSFLVALSKHSDLQAAFKADKDKVMTEAGLDTHEKNLVRSGDVDGIREYLGDEYAKASAIKVTF
jgi:hypothetical protein